MTVTNQNALSSWARSVGSIVGDILLDNRIVGSIVRNGSGFAVSVNCFTAHFETWREVCGYLREQFS